MDRKFWYLVAIVSIILLSRARCTTLLGNIAQFETFSDPDFCHINCIPERYKDEKFISTSVPVVSCNVSFHENLTCDMDLYWKTVAIDKNGNEVPVYEDTDTIEKVNEKAKGTYLYTLLESLRQCTKQDKLCPMSGDFYVDKCRTTVGLTSMPISNIWKFTLRFSKNGKEVFGFTVRLEMDDTEMIRAKKPSAGQRRRRKH